MDICSITQLNQALERAPQPCFQIDMVATRGISLKNATAAQKSFLPSTAIIKEMVVKLLAGHQVGKELAGGASRGNATPHIQSAA